MFKSITRSVHYAYLRVSRMAEHNDTDLTTEEDVERAAIMVCERENEISISEDCCQYIGDSNPGKPQMEAEGCPETTQELDDDLSETLSKVTSRLCPVCLHFFKDRSSIGSEGWGRSLLSGGKVHHSSLLSLEASVTGGCFLCKDLSKGLEDLFKKKPQLEATASSSSSIWCVFDMMTEEGAPGFKGGVSMNYYLGTKDGDHIEGHIDRLTFVPIADFGVGPQFRGDENSLQVPESLF